MSDAPADAVSSSPTADFIELGGVQLSADGIRPVGGNLATLIRKEDIQEIVVRYGPRSHHPIGSIVFSVAFAAIASVVVKYVANIFAHGGVIFLVVVCWPIAFALYGFHLAATAFVRSYYLEVHTKRGRRKLCFAPKTELRAIRQFLDALVASKYSVSREVDLSG